MGNAAFIDTSKCMACRGCQVACKDQNRLPAGITKFRGEYTNPPVLQAHTWTHILFTETESGRWLFAKYSCMHCIDAACIRVCPVEAVRRSKTGAVWHDREKCVGCGLCVDHCPFDVPHISPVTGKMAKCRGCIERVVNGYQPACVTTCPNEAIIYGKREELLEKARQRVEVLQEQGHSEARLYGAEELDGLSRLYVLLKPASEYGLPDNPRHTAGVWTWQAAKLPMRHLATVGLFAGLITAGLRWRGERILKKQKHTL
ncbi:MAG: hypothetical protein FH749_06530 [Firmicutes bacterium]|nr:hypothetical protein [Bacillota bacterium]